jgi:hypothetical protein
MELPPGFGAEPQQAVDPAGGRLRAERVAVPKARVVKLVSFKSTVTRHDPPCR